MLGRKLEYMATSLNASKSRLLNVEKEAVDYLSEKNCILLMLFTLNYKRVLSSAIFYPIYDKGGILWALTGNYVNAVFLPLVL